MGLVESTAGSASSAQRDKHFLRQTGLIAAVWITLFLLASIVLLVVF